MTAEIVNLNKFRKAREKAEDEKRAEQNRVRYGRTKAEKEQSAQIERIKERTLDGAEMTPRGVAVDDDLDPGSAS
ncbi:MAG: DUF4169 family protein [Hyphomicrobium sp.]